MSKKIKGMIIQDGIPAPDNPAKIRYLMVNDEAEKYINELQEENDQLKKRNQEIYDGYISATQELTEYAEENERLKKEKSILEKSLKLIWKKDIKINYEELDKANKIIEKVDD